MNPNNLDSDHFNPGISIDEVVERLDRLGVFSHKTSRPVFGWSPVLKGWFISVDNRPTTPLNERIRINLIPWDPSIPIPWGEETPYAKSYRKLRSRLVRVIPAILDGDMRGGV